MMPGTPELQRAHKGFNGRDGGFNAGKFQNVGPPADLAASPRARQTIP